jgi:hypothetical protein
MASRLVDAMAAVFGLTVADAGPHD